MAHNTRIRPIGLWTLDSDVLTSEFEAFDLAQFESINGDQGGTWAPASQIEIGGAGLKVSGPFDMPIGTTGTFGGTVDFASTSTPTFVAGSNTDVEAGAVWAFANAPSFAAGFLVSAGTVTFASAMTVVDVAAPMLFSTGSSIQIDTGIQVDIDGIVNFTSTDAVSVAASKPWQFNNTPDFADGLDVDGGTLKIGAAALLDVESGSTVDVKSGATLVVNGTYSLVGNGFLTGRMVLSSGGVIEKPTAIGVDADTTYSVDDTAGTYAQIVRWPTGVLTAARNITLQDAADGSTWMGKSNGNFALTIKRQNGVTIVTGDAGNWFGLFAVINGQWEFMFDGDAAP